MSARAFSLLAFFLLRLAASASAVPAQIDQLQGTVEIEKAGVPGFVHAFQGQAIGVGDKLRTGSSSGAAIVTEEGHRVLVSGDSILEVQGLDAARKDWKLNIGRAKCEVKPLSVGQRFEMRTPTAVCAVRGTAFYVTVLSNLATVLDVLDGFVGVRDIGGHGATTIGKDQRVFVNEGQPPSAPQQVPREFRQSYVPPDRREQQEVRQAMNREVGFSRDVEDIKQSAQHELKTSIYQKGETLIDVHGQRVRMEAYVTRPTPDSLKFVSLNTRRDRFDFGFVEIVANKALPTDLRIAMREMFGRIGSTAPEFVVQKMRHHMSNTQDSLTFLSLDGSAQQVAFQEKFFDPETRKLRESGLTGFQTVFGHEYQFLNGADSEMTRLWTDSSYRPDSLVNNGMVLHLVTGRQTDAFGNTFFVAMPTGGVLPFHTDLSPSQSTLADFTERTAYLDTSSLESRLAGSGSILIQRDPATGLMAAFRDTNGDRQRGALEPVTVIQPTSFPTLTTLSFRDVLINEDGTIVDVASQFGRTSDNLTEQNVTDLFDKVNLELIASSPRFSGTIDIVVPAPDLLVATEFLDPKPGGIHSK